MGTAATRFVGIDVSKAMLDACLLAPDGRAKEAAFGNDAEGDAGLIAWAGGHTAGAPQHFCLEATGAYSEALALARADAGRSVGVVNPARIEYAGLARGRGNKTDAADARPIAGYAARERPAAWHPPTPEVRELQAPVRRRDDLRQIAAREKGRLDSPALRGAARKSVGRVVEFLEAEGGKMQAAADALIAAPPELAADRDLPESIPGVGRQTASAVLAELPRGAALGSAEPAAAYAGLAPREFKSGTSVRRRTRLSKAGNARLRKALDMPTPTAVRFNPLLRSFFARLVAAGKPRMQAAGACMRKLATICFGVLKNRQPFDPDWNSKKVA